MLALVWRRSCRRMGGSPASAARAWKCRVTYSGRSAVPSSRVKTSPVSVQPWPQVWRPHRAPSSSELTTDPVHGGALATDLLDRPPARPRRQHRPRRDDPLVLLDERTDRAPRIRAHPAPLPPPDPHRPAHRRSVNQPHLDPAVRVGDDPARTTAHRLRRRLHRDRQRATLVAVDADHVQAIRANQKVTPVAVAARGTAARRRLAHRRGPRDQER